MSDISLLNIFTGLLIGREIDLGTHFLIEWHRMTFKVIGAVNC